MHISYAHKIYARIRSLMDTITKLSTAKSCSRIGTSDEYSVSDLGSKIDGPKQPIFLSLKINK